MIFILSFTLFKNWEHYLKTKCLECTYYTKRDKMKISSQFYKQSLRYEGNGT